MLQDVDEKIDFDDSCAGHIECLELTLQVLGVNYNTSRPDLLMDLAEVVGGTKIRHRCGLRSDGVCSGACLLVVLLRLRLDQGDQVIHVDLVSFCEGLDEHVLVDVADAEFGQHRTQVSHLDEFLLLPSASDSTTRLKPRPEDSIVSEELGTD
jgi:hypothetical protein